MLTFNFQILFSVGFEEDNDKVLRYFYSDDITLIFSGEIMQVSSMFAIVYNKSLFILRLSHGLRLLDPK